MIELEKDAFDTHDYVESLMKEKDEEFNKIWGFSQEMPLKEEEVEDEAAGDEEEAEGANKDEAGANIFINTYNKLLKDYFN